MRWACPPTNLSREGPQLLNGVAQRVTRQLRERNSDIYCSICPNGEETRKSVLRPDANQRDKPVDRCESTRHVGHAT